MPENDAAPEPTEEAETPTAPEAPKTLEDLLAPLGDNASIVIDQVRKARNEAKNLRDRLKDAEPAVKRLQEIEDEQKTEAERIAEKLRAAEERAAASLARAARSEIRSRAVGIFEDADDALAAMDPSKYVNEDGDVDTDAVDADLKDLLSRKPHWAKREKGLPTNPAQGSSAKGDAKPSQLSRDDLKSMTNEEINQARADGRLDDLMGRSH